MVAAPAARVYDLIADVTSDLHQVLDNELGLQPCLEARKLQHSILASR